MVNKFYSFLVILAATTGIAQAEVPSYAGFPPPGGVTYSGSGSATSAGGRTWSYSDFNPTAYGDLFYTVTTPILSFQNSATDTLSFNAGLSDLASGLAVWTGATQVQLSNYSWQTIYTEFKLTVKDFGNIPLALTSGSSVGLLGLGAVLDVNGNFKATFEFLASTTNGSGYQAARTLYDGLSRLTSGQLSSSAGGAFYATAPVPEPETYAMFAVGLGLLGFMSRRRKVRASS